MTKENTATISVPESCSVAAYGHMIFVLKKGKNIVPAEHKDAIIQAIEDSGLFKKK